jgi:hypothetical protein
MKQFLLRLLWLDDAKIKKRGRFYAILLFVVGSLNVIGGVGILLMFLDWWPTPPQGIQHIVIRLKSIAVATVSEKRIILRTIELLHTLSKGILWVSIGCGFLFLGVGGMLFTTGYLYLRLHKELNKVSVQASPSVPAEAVGGYEK